MSSSQCRNAGYEISDPTQIPPSPTVSVLMLAYNHEAYVRQAIDSILEQEVDFQFEIVVGEDCSTDGTREILLEYQSLRPDIFRIITADANVGMNENFKRTSEACRGKYVAICEADDYWTDASKLSLQLAIAERNPGVSLVVHNAISDRHNGSRRLMASIESDTNFDEVDVIKKIGQFAATASYFMRREVISSLPSWLDTAPVIDFLIEVYSQRVGAGYFIAKVMSVYRVGQPGGWTDRVLKPQDKGISFRYQMIECYEKICFDFPLTKKYLRGRAADDARHILFFSAAGDSDFYWEEYSKCGELLPAVERLIGSFGPFIFINWFRIRWRVKNVLLRKRRALLDL